MKRVWPPSQEEMDLAMLEQQMRLLKKKHGWSPAQTIHALANLVRAEMATIAECAIICKRMGLLEANR